ncbi:hypothetical protein BD310DRAFT_912517, partial [Dichomitus squalens]
MSHMSTVSLQTHVIVPVANCSVLQALLCSFNLPTSSVPPSYSTVTAWPLVPCKAAGLWGCGLLARSWCLVLPDEDF